MTPSKSLEQLLLEAAPKASRDALRSKLRLLEYKRSSAYSAETVRIKSDYRERGGYCSGPMFSQMVDRMATIAIDVGLEIIDACLGADVTDEKAITDFVVWHYERFITIEIDAWNSAPDLIHKPNDTVVFQLTLGGKNHGYNLRYEVATRTHADRIKKGPLLTRLLRRAQDQPLIAWPALIVIGTGSVFGFVQMVLQFLELIGAKKH